ncbi:TonB-dependent hemoglobin/transferrin/lactoferrin family receptor [Luteolibacter ambystomatis]|uniref:TonB-dependent hemoglobin/transferrin/lactoferrin family receptor n=1 Tax=Luteolibacter ambystomatis TaxID=2824561 RepID=A0A975IXH7_9BACT|nr:TonB-dependent hemoglobin/transferrin/lactoferrin family receptor [Luteolibacter ambystomatis]QUE49336.1 TonB-dependent hemoglobin/transferrin/lactoferrin family receptor [Luteolibacter ambystomatis]
MLSLCLAGSVPAQDAAPVVDPEEKKQDAGKEDSGGILPQLEEMVVVATRTQRSWLDTAGTVASVDREALLQTGAQDLGGIVKYDPTVVVPFDMTTGDGAVAYAASGSSSFNIRGTEGNRVGVEVDGIRQPPEYASTSFDAGAETGAGGIGRDYFDPAMFQLVEILKGGASALYGSDAMGGMVSMKTLGSDDLLGKKNWGGFARTQYFSRNEGLAWQLGGAMKEGDFDIMLVYAGREGEETANNGTIPPDPMQMDSSAWLAKAGYGSGENHFLLTLENYHRSIHADMRSALHPSIEMFNIFKKSIDNWQAVDRQRISLNWLYEPVGGVIDTLDTHVYWQDADMGTRNRSTNPRRETGFPEEWGIDSTEGRNRRQKIDFETEIYGINSIARRDFELFGLKHRFLGGVDVSQENSSNRFDRIETDGVVLPNPDGGLPIVSTRTTVFDRISFAPSETNRLGIFIQDEIELSSRWSTTLGLRGDFHQINAELTPAYLARLGALLDLGLKPSSGYENFGLSPRFDLQYKITDHTRAYAGYSMGIRNPTAEELTMIFEHPAGGFQQITVPNPDLREELSHAFKLGYKGESGLGKVGIEAFFTKYRDYINGNVPVDTMPDGTVLVTTENIGAAIIYGLEASAEWNVGETDRRFDGFTLGLSSGRVYGENQTKGTALNTVDPWKTVGWIGYQEPDAKYGAKLLGTYTAAVTRTDDTTMNGRMFRPPAWFTLDIVAWYHPIESVTLNAGVNNLFNEKYWNWSTVRRGGGHLGLDVFGGQAGSVDDRSTAAGTNFYLSATYTF